MTLAPAATVIAAATFIGAVVGLDVARDPVVAPPAAARAVERTWSRELLGEDPRALMPGASAGDPAASLHCCGISTISERFGPRGVIVTAYSDHIDYLALLDRVASMRLPTLVRIVSGTRLVVVAAHTRRRAFRAWVAPSLLRQ